MNDEIGGSFIASETGMVFICGTEFNPSSWHIKEKYMSFVIWLIADTFYSLYRHKIIDIEVERKEYNVFSFNVWTKTKCSVILKKSAEIDKPTGWLEDKIINTLNKNDLQDFDKLVFELLADALGGTQKHTNPGRMFIKAALKSQKHHFFSFKTIHTFWGQKVTVWQEPEQIHALNQVKVMEWKNEINDLDIVLLRKKVEKQLLKFHDVSD